MKTRSTRSSNKRRRCTQASNGSYGIRSRSSSMPKATESLFQRLSLSPGFPFTGAKHLAFFDRHWWKDQKAFYVLDTFRSGGGARLAVIHCSGLLYPRGQTSFSLGYEGDAAMAVLLCPTAYTGDSVVTGAGDGHATEEQTPTHPQTCHP